MTSPQVHFVCFRYYFVIFARFSVLSLKTSALLRYFDANLVFYAIHDILVQHTRSSPRADAFLRHFPLPTDFLAISAYCEHIALPIRHSGLSPAISNHFARVMQFRSDISSADGIFPLSNSCAPDAYFVPIHALEDSRQSETRFPSIQKGFAAVLRFLITYCTFLPILRFFEILHPIPCGLTNSSMRNPQRCIGIVFRTILAAVRPATSILSFGPSSFAFSIPHMYITFLRVLSCSVIPNPLFLSISTRFRSLEPSNFDFRPAKALFPAFGHVFRSPAPIFEQGRLPTVRLTTQCFSLSANLFLL